MIEPAHQRAVNEKEVECHGRTYNPSLRAQRSNRWRRKQASWIASLRSQ